MSNSMKNVVHPVFMPIFDLKTGALACYEALARTHSGHEHGPLLFTAEKYGFIHSIDVTMLETGCDVNATRAAITNVCKCFG